MASSCALFYLLHGRNLRPIIPISDQRCSLHGAPPVNTEPFGCLFEVETELDAACNMRQPSTLPGVAQRKESSGSLRKVLKNRGERPSLVSGGIVDT